MGSILESAISNAESALVAITTANGYQNTVASVQRIQQTTTSIGTLPALLILTRDLRATDEEPYGAQDWIVSLEVELAFVHDEAGNPTQSTDEVYFNWLADITKALLTDRTRGGYAIDTRLIGMEPLPVTTEQRLAGIIVDVELHIRHAYGDATAAI